MAQKQYQIGKIKFPNYEDEKGKCLEFISGFEDGSMEEHPVHGKKKYISQLVKRIIDFFF